MGLLKVPEMGWTLNPRPGSETILSQPVPTPVQIMRLDISVQKVDALINSFYNGERTHIIFGKNATIHFGTKSHVLKYSPETFKNELYHNSATDNEQLYFAGRFSHNLEVKWAQEDTADTDSSLANLQASLAQYKKDKASKASVFDRSIPFADSKKKATKANPLMKPGPLDLLKGKPQLNYGTTRSMPASPSLGASFGRSQSTGTGAPTSAPSNVPNQKLEALRRPLIHLLAIRPVSEKFMAQTTRASKERCLAILEKVGREYRLDASKWELSDRAFKELDIWSFKYSSEEDRQAAIENAISAFDRLRLAPDDKLWDKLLPVTERGKGKVLSRKDYRGGPINGRNTPRIAVQQVDDGVNGGETTGAESDAGRGRLTPNVSEPMARSTSQDAFKKKRVSEQEAASRRLFSKNPEMATKAALEKDQKKAEKTEKTERTERKETKKEPKKEKKLTSKAESKFKSAEYVQDSDDDDVVMKDAPTVVKKIAVKQPKVAEASKKKPAPVLTKKPEPKTEEKPRANGPPKTSNHKKEPSSSSSISSPPSTSDSGKSTSKAQRPTILPPKEVSRPRTTSSPTKPSPLGSSPPTNASDFEGGSKIFDVSSSNSPATRQARPDAIEKKDLAKSEKPRANGVLPTKSEPAKRKADHLTVDSGPLSNGTSAKRHQASPPSDTVGSSSGSNSPVSKHQEMLEKGQHFKKCWARYRKLHQEVVAEKNPSIERKQRLWKMHERVQQMKKEIWSETGGK